MVLQYYLLCNLINRVSIVCPVLAFHINKNENINQDLRIKIRIYMKMKKYKKVINFKFF